MPLIRRAFHPGSQRAMASAAVLVFAVFAIVMLMANFNLNYAVNQTSDAFDVFHSQMVEKNGVSQIVKESILAVAETATTQSTNSLQTEINNRLAALTFPDGGSLALSGPNSATTVPTNGFYPSGTPASASQPAYFSPSTYTRAVAGMGNLFTSLVTQGPAADLGRITFQFNRVSGSEANDSRTYTVNADLFSVPITNLDVVAYGLPASGQVPAAAPQLPSGFIGSGTSCLVVTSNNPANDATAYPDLFNPSGVEQLPYQYRNAASFSWNAYEYIWSTAYQDQLIAAAEVPTSANLPSPAPQGSVYDFAAAQEPVVTGLTSTGNAITIDCSLVTAPIIEVVDSEGIGSVTVQGSAVSGIPFVLIVRNTAGSGSQTSVTFSGNNLRPVLYYFENASLAFSNTPQILGGLLLDRTSTVTGAFAWYGHVSFYGPANPFASEVATVNDSPAVKVALEDIAPRVLLVSTNSPYTPSLAP
ncbi:MAG TPA: hypothetical protein VGL42_12265 [Opitutaceae bacterium]|jgi:hypothetical protein